MSKKTNVLFTKHAQYSSISLKSIMKKFELCLAVCTDVIIYNNKLFYLITFFVYAFQFFQRSILLSGYAPDSFKIDSTPENEMRCSKNG